MLDSESVTQQFRTHYQVLKMRIVGRCNTNYEGGTCYCCAIDRVIGLLSLFTRTQHIKNVNIKDLDLPKFKNIEHGKLSVFRGDHEGLVLLPKID